jgi:hypothetical protein
MYRQAANTTAPKIMTSGMDNTTAVHRLPRGRGLAGLACRARWAFRRRQRDRALHLRHRRIPRSVSAPHGQRFSGKALSMMCMGYLLELTCVWRSACPVRRGLLADR